MAITLNAVPEVEKKVDVRVPRPKGGFQTEKLRVTYRLLSRHEIKETFEAVSSGEMTSDDFLRRDVTNVKDVRDENGKAVEFSEVILDALLDRVDTFSALEAGWYAVQTNRQEHEEKNS